MSFLAELGALALGSRFKSLSDQLYEGADKVYRAQGSRLQARWFPVLSLLADRGPMAIGDLAAQIGQTHSAVSQLATKLMAAGLIRARSDRGDRRRRLLALTSDGEQELRAQRPTWRAIARSVDRLLAETGGEFLATLGRFEQVLASQPIAERILGQIAADARRTLRIVPWDPALAEHFYLLNAEWLQKHFYIEQIDHDVLSQPQQRIVDPGGEILFALLDDEVVGTCALLSEGEGVYELTKMAVTEGHQGLGIGRALLVAAIAAFKDREGTTLFLESNSKLASALKLYTRMGFELQSDIRPDSHYSRADVYMIWRGEGSRV